MSDSHDTLKAYIQKVLSIQDPQREKLPTQEELRALALEIGLDIQDWEALQKTFADHLTRGKGFVKYENWDDAIEELQQACVINPSHPGAAIELAKAHRQRWKQQGKEEDFQMAEKYARVCLKIDPQHDPALRLLSELKHTEINNQSSKKNNNLIIAGVILALLLSGIGYFYDSSTTDLPTKSAEENSTNMKAAPSDSPTPNSTNSTNSPSSTNIEVLNDLGIDVEFDAGRYSDNLTLLPYSSDFSPYKDAYSYKLLANLKITGIEVEEATLQVELLDETGATILTDYVNAWESHNPTARSGDLLAFGYQEYQKVSEIPALAKVKLSVQQIKALPAAPSYIPSPEIKITWTPEKPANVDLIVKKRVDRVTENIIGGIFQYLAFEVENIGNTNIKGLKFQLQWYDQNDELLESKNLFIVSSSTPPLLRGQIRVEGGTYAIKDIKSSDIKELEIIVADIDF